MMTSTIAVIKYYAGGQLVKVNAHKSNTVVGHIEAGLKKSNTGVVRVAYGERTFECKRTRACPNGPGYWKKVIT